MKAELPQAEQIAFCMATISDLLDVAGEIDIPTLTLVINMSDSPFVRLLFEKLAETDAVFRVLPPKDAVDAMSAMMKLIAFFLSELDKINTLKRHGA